MCYISITKLNSANVMKQFILFFIVVSVIGSCKKNTAINNNVNQAAGNLVKSASGDCAPVTLGGMYLQNISLTTSNYMEVQVNFTGTGSYVITSDTVNGYSFKDSGQVTSTGAQMLRLKAVGTPLLAGNNMFTIRFNSSVCQANVTVSVAPAVYTFGNTAGICSGATISGNYTSGVTLASANTVAVQVNVNSSGSYSITSNNINGMSFSKAGSFASTGPQTVILDGVGTPTVAGTFNFNTSLSGGCTFNVIVSNPAGTLAQLTTTAASGTTCTYALSGGNITNDGGSAITARGICWSSSANPTIANSNLNIGTGMGSFTGYITGLTFNNTYHARAFATNSTGTAYGNDISFTTLTGCTLGLYVTGWHDVNNSNGTTRTPKIWKNTTGSYFATALPFTPNIQADANSIFVSGSDVYVAGRANGGAMIWKNGVATPLTTPPTSTDGMANSVYVSGTDVYAVGSYEAAAIIWKNGIATTLGTGVSGAVAMSVFVSGTDSYAAGYITRVVNGNVINIATVWKNGIATYLTSGPAGANANSVFVSGNDVYVVGSEGNAAMLWKNGVPITLSSTSKAVANSVVVSGTDVYVAGTEDDGNSLNSYAKLWKNGIGSFLTTSGYRNRAWSVFILGPDVYVAGSKSTGGANTYAGVWRNGFFTPVDGGSTDAAALGIFVK